MDIRPTLFLADWVLPVASAPIRAGGVLVDGHGRIAEVGEAAALPRPADADVVELGAAALLPGLIDTHAHAELAAFRGLLEDMPFHEWIPSLMRVKRGADLAEADLGVSARWTCVEALAAGITTLACTEDSGAALDALHAAGMRGIVYREVFGPAPEQAGASVRRLQASVEELRRRETELVRVGVSPHAPYTVSDALYRLVADYALAEGLPVAAHAAEAEVESQLVTQGEGPFAAGLRSRGIGTPKRAGSVVELLDRTRLLEARPLLIHCVRVDAEDRARIADRGAAVAHCPVANARLGHGIAPLMELLEAGATVGLGTDSVVSNNRLDLLEEARAAQLFQRARLGSAGALPLERLLRLATLDGARALGLESRVGTLETGMDADLCAVSLAGPHVVPVHDPLAAVFHAARGSDVVLTVVRGRVLYRAGTHLSLNPDRLRPRLEALAARLSAARVLA